MGLRLARAAAQTFQVACGIERPACPLGVPQRFTKALHDGVFGFVYFEFLAQCVVGVADAWRLVNADLFGDRQVQRKVKKRVHLPVFGREILFDCRLGFFEQSVVFGMMLNKIGGSRFSAFKREAGTMFTPCLTKKETNLIT